RLLLELLGRGRQQLRRHPDPAAVRRGPALFQRPQHDWMAAHRRRRSLHPGRCDRQHAYLFSVGHAVSHAGDADSAGRRPGPDRTLNALAWQNLTIYSAIEGRALSRRKIKNSEETEPTSNNK